MSPILEIKINEVDHFKTKASTVFEMKTIKNIQECLCKNQNQIAFCLDRERGHFDFKNFGLFLL